MATLYVVDFKGGQNFGEAQRTTRNNFGNFLVSEAKSCRLRNASSLVRFFGISALRRHRCSISVELGAFARISCNVSYNDFHGIAVYPVRSFPL
jgi:hypothetical protein